LRIDRDGVPRRRWVLKPEFSLIEMLPQIARDFEGHPLASPELVVIISRPWISDNQSGWSCRSTGAAGGLLPAIRAARIPVARALREI
jgi:hypothetical protein